VAHRRELDPGLRGADAGSLPRPADRHGARTINFDPLVLPAGIEGSDDPLLSARSAAYSVSFRRRAGEPVSPSAVTSAEVGE
jgi:hypothetical protein